MMTVKQEQILERIAESLGSIAENLDSIAGSLVFIQGHTEQAASAVGDISGTSVLKVHTEAYLHEVPGSLLDSIERAGHGSE